MLVKWMAGLFSGVVTMYLHVKLSVRKCLWAATVIVGVVNSRLEFHYHIVYTTSFRNCPRQCISSKTRRTPQSHDLGPKVCVIMRWLLLPVFGSCGLDLQTSSIQLSFLTDLLLRPRAMFSSLTNLTTASFLRVSVLMKRDFAACVIMISNTR